MVFVSPTSALAGAVMAACCCDSTHRASPTIRGLLLQLAPTSQVIRNAEPCDWNRRQVFFGRFPFSGKETIGVRGKRRRQEGEQRAAGRCIRRENREYFTTLQSSILTDGLDTFKKCGRSGWLNER